MGVPKRLAAIAAFCLAATGLSTATGPSMASAATRTTSRPVVLYAAPDGTGAACAVSAPCGLSGAKSRVEQLNAHMTADIDVDLSGGTYRVPGGFRLGPAASGDNGYTVVWQAAPGQAPVISGADRITGFARYDQRLNIWRARVPLADATTGGQQLFVNGQRAQLARSAGAPRGLRVTSTGFSTTDAAYAAFTNQSQIEVVDEFDWKHMSCPVRSITTAPGGGSDINILPSCWQANNRSVPNLGFPYNGAGLPAMYDISYVENAYQLLTQPGQFYLDQSGGYLYYIPRPGQRMVTADVELPVQQSLLTLQGNPGHLTPVNQNGQGASYSGTGWRRYANRGHGDLDNDVEATTTNGDSATYVFSGTGLEVLAETYSDEGTFDVYVDGKRDTRQNFTEDTSGNTRLAQQVVYSVEGLSRGRHTVKIVKTGGTYLTIDGFVVIPDAIDRVRDVAFRHIAFEYSTWNLPETTGYIDNQAGVLWDTSGTTPEPAIVPAAVTVSRGSGITFADDAFLHLGATAVDLADGTQDSGVYNSVITDTAGGGISAGEVDDYFQNNPALMTSHDTIAGNAISYVGQDYSDTVGVWAGYTRNLTITHNDIGHTPYSGVSLGWGWGYASPCSTQAKQGLLTCAHGTIYAGGNHVTGNYVHDVMNTLYDGGPVYTNGGQGENGAGVYSVLAGNYVSIGNHDDNMLYQDEGSSYWHTYDNVVNFAADGNWIGMWTPTDYNITVGPADYSSAAMTLNNGTDITYATPTVVSGGAWPAAARAIMTAAGLPDRPAPPVYDDDNQALSYTGDWQAQGTASDQGDSHSTTSPGASVSLTFTGRSVAFVAAPAGGTAAISIDGRPRGDVRTDALAGSGQTVFTGTALPPGRHMITVTNVTGQLAVGSFQVPAQPYLNVRSGAVPPVPGRMLTVKATVGDPGPVPLRHTRVTLAAPAGWIAGAPAYIGTVPAGGRATATLTVMPPSSLLPGTALLTGVARFSSGSAAQQVLLGSTRIVTPYTSLAAAFNNAGVSTDSNTGAANLDGVGYSFSATALKNAGVTPGSAVTAGGLSFTWPSAAPGSADNVVASGQEIAVHQSGRRLGFLDTATFGPAQGEGTIVYAGGATQTFTLSVPDWYSGAAAGAAISMAYRNAPGNAQDYHRVGVYEQSVALDSTATVVGVILPSRGQGGSGAALHVFALAIG
jgi:hypothetical protein